MNDFFADVLRLLLRLVLVAGGFVFFLSLLAAALVLALVWGLRAVWARLTGRPITPWTTRIDPRAGADEAPSSVPVHLRPLPGADEVTDVQPREPGEK